MVDLNILENDQDHEKIACLEGKEFDRYRAIALIHLGKYNEALKFVNKGSFEAAYVYYKLKNYKKALKIISKFSDEKGFVLKSQILYSMGFYNKAYEALSTLPKDDEVVINLQAMKSMAILTHNVNRSCGHKLWMKKRDELMHFDKLENHKFSNEDSRIEFFFNKTFEEAHDIQKYLEALRTAQKLFNGENIISKQLNNIEGSFDEIDPETLSKTQKEILLYNMHKTDKIVNPIHFLKNFTGNLSDSEYNWLQHAKSNEFNLNPFNIPSTSENLKLLRIFIGLKHKSMVKSLVLAETEKLATEKFREILRAYYLEDSGAYELTPKIANLTI
ncbi:hypothetical protein NGRA_1618 [Nosema granulosis]|uniref:Tetratricopeptide repeat protein n=1 Tax=Nosema granulosis TaxID=83296 RepID=A0A9P6GZQ4_9MICR|nr:hypothetical protein NGRA_1618 [Nosema granulosis]